MLAHATLVHAGKSYSLDTDLVECNPTLTADGQSGTCELLVRNDSAQYGTLGSPVFEPNDQLLVSLYRKSGPLSTPVTIFNGLVQSPRYLKDFGGTGNKYMRIKALDGSAYLQYAYVNTAYFTYLASAPGYTVDYIVKDLVTNPGNLMDYQANVNRWKVPITVSNVQASPVNIRNMTFNQQSLFSAINQMAQYAYSNFYVDAALDLHFFQVDSVPSAQVLDSTVLKNVDFMDDGTDIVNTMAVDGGLVDTIDDAQLDTTGGTRDTYGQWQAVQFTTRNYNLDAVQLYLIKLQPSGLIPITDLQGEIRTDNSGTPAGGSTIATFDLNSFGVALNANWVVIQINTTLVPNTPYWVVLYHSGTDLSHEYKWYYGASTGSRKYALSADGSTWTVYSDGHAPAFQELVSTGILTIVTDPTSVAKYGGIPRDGLVQDLALPYQQQAGQLGSVILGLGTNNWGTAKKKRWGRVNAFPTDTIINPGEYVNVVDSDTGLNDWFTAIQVSYQIKDVDCLSVSYQLQRFEY